MDKNKQVFVVVAHPDDEIIGCGSTMAKHAAQGDRVHVLFVADGVTSRTYQPGMSLPRTKELKQNAKALKQRKHEAKAALQVIGVNPKDIYFLDLKDQRLDTYPILDIIKRIEAVKAKVNPDTVYTHFYGDLNLDHVLVSRAVMTAFRPRPSGEQTDVLMMEIPETTHLGAAVGQKFIPNHVENISSYMGRKIQALDMYGSEARAYPDKRSTRYLKEWAKIRGERKKYPFAEAFVKVSYRISGREYI